jgi:hypothetical protein
MYYNEHQITFEFDFATEIERKAPIEYDFAVAVRKFVCYNAVTVRKIFPAYTAKMYKMYMIKTLQSSTELPISSTD